MAKEERPPVVLLNANERSARLTLEIGGIHHD
jgi:hypothetical protein